MYMGGLSGSECLPGTLVLTQTYLFGVFEVLLCREWSVWLQCNDVLLDWLQDSLTLHSTKVHDNKYNITYRCSYCALNKEEAGKKRVYA